MAKRKRQYRRRRAPRRKRRYSKPKPPLELMIGAAAIPFTPAAPGWGSMFTEAMSGNFEGVVNSLKKGFLNMETDGRIDIIGAINPFDPDRARYSKMLLYSALIGMFRKKTIGRYTTPLFKKIPFVGRYIS